VPVDQSTAVISIAYASIAGALLVMVGLAIRGAMVRGTLITAGLAAALVPGGLHLESGVAAVDKLLLQPRLRARLTAPSPAIETVRDHGSGEPFRIAPIEDVLFQGAQAYWGLESTGTADAVRLRAIEDLSDLSGVERTSWIWRTALHAGDGATVGRFLDLLNVRYLVTRVDRVPAGAHVLEQRGADQLCIVERPTAWPRAFFAAGVGRHRGVHEFARLLALADGPFVSVEEREDAAVAAVYGLPERGPIVPASKYILTPNTSAFRVHAPGAGVAVLSESFVDRDFRATLNDQPVPYIRVNHAFKGVAIPGSGEWDVRFEYRPDLWGPAWAAAGLGLAWVAALLVFSRLRPDAVQGDDHRR
jgi:hypothetical protein